MPERLCGVGNGLAPNVPVIVLQALFSSGPTFPAWHDLLLTGARYSAVEYQRTRAVDLRVFASAPHDKMANLLRSLFRLEICFFSLSTRSLN